VFAAVHTAIASGFVRACHDLSEGGLAVALAEMAFAGGIGVDVTDLAKMPGEGLDETARLFSESTTRFLIEAKPEHAADLARCFADVPFARIGRTLAEPRVRVAGSNAEWLLWVKLAELKNAWQRKKM
jgi:phosphoribosylformylglycinamidine synthase